MAKADDMILWRCRGCGELHDQEARRDARPRCDGCGLSKERFDEPPPTTEVAAAATRKRSRRRTQSPAPVEAAAPAVAPPQPDGLTRGLISSITNLGGRLSRLEEREQEPRNFLAKMIQSVSNLSITQLQIAFETTERVGQDMMEAAAHFKREIEMRKSAS